MIRLRAMMRQRRSLAVAAAVLLVALLLAPLTQTAQAHDLGLPTLVNRSQLRVLTTVAMFVALASSWNIIGGITGYAAFGNVAFFGLGAYATEMLVDRDRAGLPFAVGLIAAPISCSSI